MVREKKYLFSAIIAFMIATLMMFLMTSCFEKEEAPKIKEKEEIAQVSAESIKYDGETLTWNSVLHADSYEIKADNEVTTTTEAKWDKVFEKNVTFEIRGLVDEANESYKSCSTSTSKSFEFKGKITVNREGRTLNWEAVADAKGYKIMENGTLYHGYQDETSYDLVAVEQEDGTLRSTFKVKAEFEDEKYFTVWSDEISVQILTKPTNVKYDGNYISWDPVKGADQYEISIKNTDSQGTESNAKKETVTDNKYVFKANGDDDGSGNFEAIQSGTFSFDIVAKAKDNPNILDSDVARFSLSYAEPIENIYMVDGVVTWDAVPNADYYILKINGTEIAEKVYTNRYEGIKDSCTIHVMPQREDNTMYSNWSAPASLTYVETPYLNWVFDKETKAYYLDWSKKENDELYPKDQKTFTVISYEVYGDDIQSFEYVSGESNRTITTTATMNYSELLSFARFTQGKKYAVRVLATSGNQQITTASSQLSNPVFFYFVTEPSAYTQSTKEIYTDKLTTKVLFNAVQIPEAFKGFNLEVLYRCRLTNSTAFEVEGGEYSTSTTRVITIKDADDTLEHKYTLGIETCSTQDKTMLEDANGNKCVFMFNVDPTATNEKTYELIKLTTPNVTLTDSTLTWDSISKASGYMVKIVPEGKSDAEAKVIPTSSRAYSLSELEAGSYDVYVAARGNGNIVLSSKYSNVFKIRKLATPTNVHVEKITDNERYLTWDPIEGCGSYQYTLGTSVNEANYNQTLSISQSMLSTAGVNFSVVAMGGGVDGNGHHLISSNSSEIIMLYKLATPKNVILDNDVVRWDQVNAIGGSSVGYNVYNGAGNLMNAEGPLQTTLYDLYDYPDLKADYGNYSLTITVETVVLAENENNYWPSDPSTFYTVQRLASPTNIHMNQYTGEITWDQYSGANPDYVAGYSVKIVYEGHDDATESYYVTTNSFTPAFRYFDDTTVEITVRAVGNMVDTISSNPYNVTDEGQDNKIGCYAKLEKLAALENLDSVTYDVDEENHIKVCIDANKAKIKGNGYGISIGGVNNVVRTYNEGEGIYQLVAGTNDVYEYTLANGSKAQYNSTTNMYTYISRYSSAGTYNIKVRVEGGNYSQDPNTVSEKTICYVSSEYTAQSRDVIILGQFAQNELRLIVDKTQKYMIQFNNMESAKSYEYTIKYTRAGGIAVGEVVEGTLNVTSAFSTIELDIPANANSIVITIRALGDNETVFDSIRTTTTEIIISNRE